MIDWEVKVSSASRVHKSDYNGVEEKKQNRP